MVSHLTFDEIPADLRTVTEQLNELVMDLHWTWNHGGDVFWNSIDADAWSQTHNPLVVLQNLSVRKLRELCTNPTFNDSLERLITRSRAYRKTQRWGHDLFPVSGATADTNSQAQIAYFSMEFGLGSALPLYAGGLGILAGDYLKAASDLGVPLLGVSLLYHEGYFRQMIDAHLNQQEIFAHIDSRNLPIRPLMIEDGGWLRITIDFPGRAVHLRVWETRVGCVRLFLLDSNDPLNSPSDQGITSRLYGGSVEERLMQQIALGIGGWRVIEALQAPIKVCHLNEGHAAFATIERARHYMERNRISFWDALWATRAGNVFTTHTPIAAAFDLYPAEMLARYGSAYSLELHVDANELAGLGREDPTNHAEAFNMAFLAMRTCAQANGVSELHGKVSRHIFRSLYPGWPEDEVPIGHVTNGVHVPTWDSPWSDQLWTEACGKERWRVTDTELGEEIGEVTNEDLWNARERERQDLVTYVRRRLTRQLGIHGAPKARIARASTTLDANVLTLAFARRFTEYKRPNLLLNDTDRLSRLLMNPSQPVQIIIAGKAHPNDQTGKALLSRWIEFSNREDVFEHVVFLEDYDIALAQELVQGVDVWINTPRRPWEACGTSGMKVLVNGGLNVSTLDGWWAEAYKPEFGWALGSSDSFDLTKHTDEEDALELYQLLESEIIPEFYYRDSQGIPQRWLERIRRSMTELAPRFSANRMVRQYAEAYYLPAFNQLNARTKDNSATAIKQQQSTQQLQRHWAKVLWGEINITSSESNLSIEVPCYLGDIDPEFVSVELYANADQATAQPAFLAPMNRDRTLPGSKNGFVYQLAVKTQREPADFTPRLVPNRESANIPIENHLIHWWHGERRQTSVAQRP